MNEVCPRCNKVHTCLPVDPEKIADEHAKEMADQIDEEVMRMLFSGHGGQTRINM